MLKRERASVSRRKRSWSRREKKRRLGAGTRKQEARKKRRMRGGGGRRNFSSSRSPSQSATGRPRFRISVVGPHFFIGGGGGKERGQTGSNRFWSSEDEVKEGGREGGDSRSLLGPYSKKGGGERSHGDRPTQLRFVSSDRPPSAPPPSSSSSTHSSSSLSLSLSLSGKS